MPASSYSIGLGCTGLVLAVGSIACEPDLVVGKFARAQSTTCVAPDDGEGGAPGIEDKVVGVPWSTGFEEGICDYVRSGGFCYGDGEYTQEIVDAPVHGGRSAAAFSVTSTPAGSHTRCFLEGALPREAFYGAWFYVPEFAENTGNWNLMYFQAIVPPRPMPGLWDVSLSSSDDGRLQLYIFSHTGQPLSQRDPALSVPIGDWFHVEFRLLRAADATGEVALYQDGVLVQEGTGIVTDDSDFGQWYVGNLANGLMPPQSTVYVDDVTVSATLATR